MTKECEEYIRNHQVALGVYSETDCWLRGYKIIRKPKKYCNGCIGESCLHNHINSNNNSDDYALNNINWRGVCNNEGIIIVGKYLTYFCSAYYAEVPKEMQVD